MCGVATPALNRVTTVIIFPDRIVAAVFRAFRFILQILVITAKILHAGGSHIAREDLHLHRTLNLFHVANTGCRLAFTAILNEVNRTNLDKEAEGSSNGAADEAGNRESLACGMILDGFNQSYDAKNNAGNRKDDCKEADEGNE